MCHTQVFFILLSLCATLILFILVPQARAERVTNGLVVLYTFEENNGVIIHDVSGVTPALDLIDNTPTATSWITGGLSVNDCTVIASTGAATKIYDACTASNEITLEAWIKPENLTQTGPARIMTFSLDSGFRNFTLGQYETQVALRVRTTDTTTNGTPTFYSNTGALSTGLIHVVCTRDSAGAVAIYIDSMSVSTTSISGNFSNWNTTYQFAFANELSSADRRWFGELHLAAVYSRALSAPEVLQNFTHSADATPTATPATPTATPTATQSPFSATATPSSQGTSTPTITPSPSLTTTNSPTKTHTSETTSSPTNTHTFSISKSVFTYPQPAKDDTLYFYFKLAEPAKITIEIINVAGERVKTLTFNPATAGELRYAWDITPVAPGIYFYRVSFNYSSGKTEKLGFNKIAIVKR